ncbi:MAG: MobF family relaxase [Rhodopila sp.]
MLGFAKIAGGAPSSVRSMTAHLMNSTLMPEQARLAAYYGRGMVTGQPDMPPEELELRATRLHFEKWLNNRAAPDLTRLADYAEQHAAAYGSPGIHEAIENKLGRDLRNAVYWADVQAGTITPLTSEQRAAHGLPDIPKSPRYLRDVPPDELRARLDKLSADWFTATSAAMERGDRRASQPEIDPNAPLAVVRQDLHPLAAIGLGIDPSSRLTTDQINALLAGRRADGQEIVGKQYAKERNLPADPKTGEERISIPIGSYDFCPTPDKTVSVAWGMAEPVEQAAIYNAHIEAAREAVAYIADEVGKIRLGKGGMEGREDGHVAWLEFTHHTSRRVQIKQGKITTDLGPGDPDLHTHFLIPNAVFGESGKVGSLDTAAIGGFIFEADAFYHARLGQKLRDAGFDVALDQRTSAARMSIIPEDVRTLFSKRTNAGEALARKMTADEGLDWDALSNHERATRTHNATQSYEQKQKGGKDDVADFADWRRQAKDVAGWEPPASLQLYGPPRPPLTNEQRIQKAYEIGLPYLEEALNQSAVIKHWDVRVAALRGLVETGIQGLDDVKAVTRTMATEGVIQNGVRTDLVWGEEAGKRYVSVTTKLHQAEEREFIGLMKDAAQDRSNVIPRGLLKQKIRQSGLDFSDDHGKAQKAAIWRVGNGGRFSLIIGAAGMGKSASIAPLAAAYGEMGREVWGTSLAWRQADDLALKPAEWTQGIRTTRVKAFSVLMDGIEAGDIKLTKDSVLFLDEFGMLGTRSGLRLLRAQQQHGFAVVALGDDKQCSSIEAGPIIDLSRRALGARNVPEILTTRRQKTEREREIVGLLREGETGRALAMKREDGTAELVAGGRQGVIARVAKLYAERLAATGEAPTISASTNMDAHDISAAVRLERRGMGLIGVDIWKAPATDGERTFTLHLAKGDHVRLFKSTTARLGLGKSGAIGRNGSVLEVVDADKDGLTLKNAKGNVGKVAWGTLRHKETGRVHLAYGDAMTINTAQGSSRREHISAFPEGSERVTGNHAYSSLTRHFLRSYMLTSDQAERISVQKSRPINDPRPITDADKWARVAKSFANIQEKDSAIALAERVGGLRQAGARSFQKTLLPAQPGHRVENALSRGRDVVEIARVRITSEIRVIGQTIRQETARAGQAIGHQAKRIRQAVHHRPPDQSGPRLRI